jgi:5-methyltetrahydropteroyltriglutamate--homocysteine methyltransferase
VGHLLRMTAGNGYRWPSCPAWSRTPPNVVEHPELAADRIVRFTETVSKENVVASTDCGLDGQVHLQIAWAKLDTLVRGAEVATSQLWG